MDGSASPRTGGSSLGWEAQEGPAGARRVPVSSARLWRRASVCGGRGPGPGCHSERENPQPCRSLGWGLSKGEINDPGTCWGPAVREVLPGLCSRVPTAGTCLYFPSVAIGCPHPTGTGERAAGRPPSLSTSRSDLAEWGLPGGRWQHGPSGLLPGVFSSSVKWGQGSVSCRPLGCLRGWDSPGPVGLASRDRCAWLGGQAGRGGGWGLGVEEAASALLAGHVGVREGTASCTHHKGQALWSQLF